MATTWKSEFKFLISDCKPRANCGTVCASWSRVVEAGIETAKGRAIFSRRSPVLKFCFLVGFFALIASPLSIFAQTTDDPSETFLKAYMTAQQAEKLEHEGQFSAALAKYRFAGSLIEQLRKTHADWQPAIVDYRGRKVSEAILRVQGKASTDQDLNAGPAQLPGNAPVLPEQSNAPEPNVEITTGRPNEAPSPAARTAAAEPTKAAAPKVDDAAIKDATKKLQSRVDQLEADLQKARDKFVDAQKEKDALNAKLKESESKIDKAQAEVGKSRDAEKKLRDQLEDAHQALKKVETSKGSDSKAQEALRAEIATLKKNLAAVEQGRSLAEKERDDASARIAVADKRTTDTAKERDDALGRLAGLNGAQKRVDSLITENSELKKKLADAEKSVRDLNADKPKKEKELADVRRQ